MKKPREFWTDGTVIYDKEDWGENPSDFPEEMIYVIEKSAADKLADALEYVLGAAKNELSLRGLPLEWSANSGIAVGEQALKEYRGKEQGE